MFVTFTVPGEPTGKGRPRITKWGAHTPEKTVLYENLVKTAYDSEMLQGEIALSVEAFYQIPSSASKKKQELMRSGELRPTKKPDCDNVLKIVADALNGIAYKDDSQVVFASVSKQYADTPKVIVTLQELKGETK